VDGWRHEVWRESYLLQSKEQNRGRSPENLQRGLSKIGRVDVECCEMTTWSDEIECPGCRAVGHDFWGEGGYQDRDEWTVEIWGDFTELPPLEPPWLRQSRGRVVCRRCGISPLAVVSEQVVHPG